MAIWPLPNEYYSGATPLEVDVRLDIALSGLAAESGILLAATTRYKSLFFTHGDTGNASASALSEARRGGCRRAALPPRCRRPFLPARAPPPPRARSRRARAPPRSRAAPGERDDRVDEEDLQLATATSYELAVDTDGTAKISAPTVFGALYALETLSQLITYEPDGDYYKLSRCPVLVRDGPRFKFRGLMVDIARHFVARPMLERVVDAMSAAKLNVLHLHLGRGGFPCSRAASASCGRRRSRARSGTRRAR